MGAEVRAARRRSWHAAGHSVAESPRRALCSHCLPLESRGRRERRVCGCVCACVCVWGCCLIRNASAATHICLWAHCSVLLLLRGTICSHTCIMIIIGCLGVVVRMPVCLCESSCHVFMWISASSLFEIDLFVLVSYILLAPTLTCSYTHLN